MSAPKYPGWCESGRDGFPQCRRVELERELANKQREIVEFLDRFGFTTAARWVETMDERKAQT